LTLGQVDEARSESLQDASEDERKEQDREHADGGPDILSQPLERFGHGIEGAELYHWRSQWLIFEGWDGGAGAGLVLLQQGKRSNIASSRFIRNAGFAPVAQMDRACASEAQGRGFEPLRARHILKIELN
jgi:hypothetical protein